MVLGGGVLAETAHLVLRQLGVSLVQHSCHGYFIQRSHKTADASRAPCEESCGVIQFHGPAAALVEAIVGPEALGVLRFLVAAVLVAKEDVTRSRVEHEGEGEEKIVEELRAPAEARRLVA